MKKTSNEIKKSDLGGLIWKNTHLFFLIVICIFLVVGNVVAQNVSLDGSFKSIILNGGSINASVVQPDGKLIVAGRFQNVRGVSRTRIVRLNTDGTVDTSFNPGSSSNVIVPIYSLAIQSDGKILVGGQFTSFNGITVGNIVRLNPDGGVDTSFGAGGEGFKNTGGQVLVQSITVKPDGKILVGGRFSTYNTVTRKYIAQLNTDGTLDASFDAGTGSESIAGDDIYTVSLQADGKVIVGGNFIGFNGAPGTGIIRLNENGSRDAGFNVGGNGPGGGNHYIHSTVVQSDGKILVGGTFSTFNDIPRKRIVRLNSDGTVDNTFDPASGADGTTDNLFLPSVRSIVVQPDGKILIGGNFTTFNNQPRNLITRLNANGSEDVSFDTGTGLTSKQRGAIVNTISTLPNGDIAAGGVFFKYKDRNRVRLAIINGDGSPDDVNTPIGELGRIADIAVQPDKKVVIAGFFETVNGVFSRHIARLNEDGTNDPAFVPAYIDSSDNVPMLDEVTLQPDGKVLIAGAIRTVDGNILRNIARLNADGSYDPTFVGRMASAGSRAKDMILQPDGKIIIIGSFVSYLGNTVSDIVRTNSDGSFDSTFNTGTGALRRVNAAVLLPNGKIVIGGEFVSFNGVTLNGIAKLNSDGSLDTSFNTGSGLGGTAPFITSMARQADGKIIIGGTFETINNIARFGIARLNENGDVDTAFNSLIGNQFSGFNRILIQPNGKILVAGANFYANGYYSLLRLNTDGSIDTTFTRQQIGGSVEAIEYQGANKIIAGGFFEFVNNEVRIDLLRLNISVKTASDFDGDGRADVAVFRPSNGVWYLLQSNNGFTAAQFGISTDKVVSDDYDGDGKTDIAIYRDGVWWILQSSNNQVIAVTFGSAEDKPQSGDYDGDGKADYAVYRPSSGVWYVLRSSDGGFSAFQFGIAEDVPQRADFDGDGKTDYAVYRPSNGIWYVQKSSGGVLIVQFGVSTDIPTANDFDGDGKADIAVFRPSTGEWHQLSSGNGQYGVVTFGQSGDVPAAADYDGDGKADYAVYRGGIWYLLRSTSGFLGLQFGLPEDTPVPGR